MRVLAKVAMGLAALAALTAHAQISLSSAVDLALRNSPKVKLAQTDVAKAQAAWSEARDVYIPTLSTSGGDGKSTGVPLGLPVVFSVTSQSLAFNFSQRDYIRAARAGIDAAQLSLVQAQDDVAEDTASTYVALDNARQRRAAMQQATEAAGLLVRIVQERYDAGAEAHIEVSRSLEQQAQFKLEQLQVEDDIRNLTDHLNRVTGLTQVDFVTLPESIPQMTLPAAPKFVMDSPGIDAAMVTAHARAYTAHGDKRYRLLPQVAFEAEYSRITTVGNNYSEYYPGFNTNIHQGLSFNALGIGVQITLPILDYLHAAKARESSADAAHALYQAEVQQMDFQEGRAKLVHSVDELAARGEVAKYARDIAQDELETVRLQLQPGAGANGGAQMSPKDEQHAVLQERQKYLDLLNDQLQLEQAMLSLMEQQGTFSDWLHKAIPEEKMVKGVLSAPEPQTAP